MKVAWVVALSSVLGACGEASNAPEAVVVAPARVLAKAPEVVKAPAPRKRGARLLAPGCASCECVNRGDGEMFCDGTGFKTCQGGSAIYRDCAPGTACTPTSGSSIVCDWPD